MLPKLAALLAATLVFCPVARAQRPARFLSDGWRFFKGESTVKAKTDTWETVEVPHTWNVADGADGLAAEPQYPDGYYRGPGWYAHPLDLPADWKGKRVFIRFEGVSLVADVFVNGVPVGQHRGGFAAFCYELTSYLRFDGHDSLRVRADNARSFDVAPLLGDFTVFGGIYRPVQVFTTEDVCITPLEFGAPGAALLPRELTPDAARYDASARLSNAGPDPASVRLEVEIKDAAGASVARETTTVEVPAEQTVTAAQPVSIPLPHFWNGRPDPYLYSATFRVLHDDRTIDEVRLPLGVRTAAITREQGFVLNGQPYSLHGVNRHQDRAGKGWALSDADHDADHALIEELGATTVRLAHYQQADHFHDLSDRTGLIEWQEIPLVEALGGSPQFLANACQQLTEMILQGRQHPAIAMWGLFNELDAKWAVIGTAPTAPIIADLQKLAHELDPARPTVGASWPQDASPRHRIPDWTTWNLYPGWYSAQPGDATGWIDKYTAQMGKRIGLSEYGAGANPAQHAEGQPKRPEPGGPFHPQEWQNLFHESVWAQCKDNPKLFGTWLWAMFDFAVDNRNEGSTPGINDKGLVTRDRQTKKDTFYFYKANWNPEPMVFIASSRFTVRKQAVTEIKAYSNCPEVELRVNGQPLATVKPDGTCVCRWENVMLSPGRNTVEAVGVSSGKRISFSCEWTLEP